MKPDRLLLCLASFAAFLANADTAFGEGIAERSRAEVVADVLSARAAGVLTRAGEGPFLLTPVSSLEPSKVVERDEVIAQVGAARTAHALAPAGEAAEYVVTRPAGWSVVSRAQVKASVLEARETGQLIPAGEAMLEAKAGPDAPRRRRASKALVATPLVKGT